MKWWLNIGFIELDQHSQIAQLAEECGFEGIAFSDHLAYPETMQPKYPYSVDGTVRWNPKTPWPDPWVAIASMAAVTKRLRFTTEILIAPLRDPFTLAKSIATASTLSEGRVSCGLGVGWMEEEFKLVGTDFRTRGARLDEMIDVMRRLWTGEMVDYHGRHYTFPRIQMSPPSYGPIRILIGGHTEPAMRRAARHDGWIGVHRRMDDTRRLVESVRTKRASGRPADGHFEIVLTGFKEIITDISKLMDMGVSAVSIPVLAIEPTPDVNRRVEAIRALAKLAGLRPR